MTEERKTSPWVYVGIGCAIVLGFGVVMIGGIAFWGYRTVKNLEREMKDPAARLEKVKSVLGCTELPEGYHATMGLTIPYVMEMAIISDIEPGADGSGESGRRKKVFGSRGFIYVKTLRGRNDEKLDEYFEGKTDAADFLRPGRVDVEPGETLTRGSLERSPMKLRYVAQRGSIRVRRDRVDGVFAVMQMECPEETKLRLGIWFGPDPDPDSSAEDANLTGSPADPAAIDTFISHFSPCGP